MAFTSIATTGPLGFSASRRRIKSELEDLVQLISQRVGRCLERQGLLEQDTESAWLELEPADDTDAMPHLLGSSVSYRIAVGPQQGRKAFMIRTIRPLDRPDPGLERVAKANGFSLHAGVSCEGHQKDKRERLCRYIARPAVAVPRLSLSSTGKVLYTLKTPYRDGTTQVAFDPVDFIARLAALVPKPRVNLTRYHGVLAPNHRWRGMVTPAKRGKGVKRIANTEVRSPAERHVAMSWAQRLKRVFNIDIEVCGRCGGSVKVIACIEDQDVIDRILAHLREKEQEAPARPLLVPPTRAPPETLPLFAGKETVLFTVQSAGTPLNDSWHRFLCASVREWMEKICEGADTSAISRRLRMIERHLRVKDLGARVDFFPIPHLYCLYLRPLRRWTRNWMDMMRCPLKTGLLLAGDIVAVIH